MVKKIKKTNNRRYFQKKIIYHLFFKVIYHLGPFIKSRGKPIIYFILNLKGNNFPPQFYKRTEGN